jgi:hypothetical protein
MDGGAAAGVCGDDGVFLGDVIPKRAASAMSCQRMGRSGEYVRRGARA